MCCGGYGTALLDLLSKGQPFQIDSLLSLNILYVAFKSNSYLTKWDMLTYLEYFLPKHSKSFIWTSDMTYSVNLFPGVE